MPFNITQIDKAVHDAFREVDNFLYTPLGFGQVTIDGFWQEPDVNPESGGLEFTTQGPMVVVLASDITVGGATGPTQSDLVTRVSSSQNYQVKEFEVDEGGLWFLQLEETT